MNKFKLFYVGLLEKILLLCLLRPYNESKAKVDIANDLSDFVKIAKNLEPKFAKRNYPTEVSRRLIYSISRKQAMAMVRTKLPNTI